MELAYLGLFTKIYSWIMDKIFDPIYKFVSDLLSTILSWVFNNILAPILFPILEEVLEFAIDLYKTIYSFQLYSLFAGILKLVDYLEIAFDVFIGRREITYITDSGAEITGTLLEVLVQHEVVSTVFWLLTLGGIGIALILTIIGTAKSAFDLDFENKRPVSKVLTAMMKTFIQFFTVPLFVYLMLTIATDILNVTISALSGGVDTTLGRIVFMIASLNAAREKTLNASYISSGKNVKHIILGTSPADTSRFPFYIKNQYVSGATTIDPIDYIDVKAVNKVFNLADFDYLIGGLAAIFLLFVMAVCVIKFVQRIFEIVLLYIVSPYFVSTMPLDDGEKFGRWRDLFIGKCFTGFGSAIGMRLYLMVCQLIMSGNIKFSADATGSSIEIDYFMKLFFLLGGAWAVFKSGPLITSLISSGAGQQEQMTQSAVGGSLYAHTVGTAIAKGRGALTSAFRGKGGAGALSRSRAAKNADPMQKFAGAKGDRMAKAGLDKNQKSKDWKKATVSAGAKRSNVTIGKNRKPILSAANAKAATPQMRSRSNAIYKDPKHLAAAKAAVAAGSLKNPSLAPKEKGNFHLGRVIQSTYDANGNHKIRVMGFGVDRDAKGNTMAFKMPIMGMKLQKTDSDQSMKLARLHIPGVTRIDSNIQNGQLKYSDISVLHGAVRYNSDESGSRYRVLGGVANVGKDQSGTNVRVLGGLTNVHHGQSGTDVNVMGGLTRVHHGNDGTHVRVLGGLTDVQKNASGTHVGVMGVHGHSYTSGGGGFDMLGGHVSVRATSDKLQSLKVGALEYNASGVYKSVPQTSSAGSAPSGGTVPTLRQSTPAPSASATQKRYTPPRPTGPAPRPPKKSSTNKPGSGTKPGGK